LRAASEAAVCRGAVEGRSNDDDVAARRAEDARPRARARPAVVVAIPRPTVDADAEVREAVAKAEVAVMRGAAASAVPRARELRARSIITILCVRGAGERRSAEARAKGCCGDGEVGSEARDSQGTRGLLGATRTRQSGVGSRADGICARQQKPQIG